MAMDLSNVLLPDLPGVADTADNEVLSIRGYLQQIAVAHNTLVQGTGTFTEEQKAVNAQAMMFAMALMLFAKNSVWSARSSTRA